MPRWPNGALYRRKVFYLSPLQAERLAEETRERQREHPDYSESALLREILDADWEGLHGTATETSGSAG